MLNKHWRLWKEVDLHAAALRAQRKADNCWAQYEDLSAHKRAIGRANVLLSAAQNRR
jgi:hypothetical protein